MSSQAYHKVQSAFRNGTLTGESLLLQVPYIGPYLNERMARVVQVAPNALNIRSIWDHFAPFPRDRVLLVLERALQNDRANQCVLTAALPAVRPEGRGEEERRYHAGDINERGFSAVVSVLEWARRHPRPPPARVPVYGALPRTLPPRSVASRVCGCLDPARCALDRRCALAEDGTSCVPRAPNARGFPGVTPFPNQVERASTPAARRTLRSRARVRTSAPMLARHADVARDVARGHSKSVRYVSRGRRAWRRPSAKVRLPVLQR